MAINQLKAGAILSYISIGLNNLVGLFYTPYMLRMLGQNEYGLYSLAASVIAYLTVLDLGFANAIVRYTAKLKSEYKNQEQYEMFGMFLILYTFIGLVAFVLGLVIYFNVDRLFDASLTFEDIEKIRIMMLLMCFNLAFTFPMSIWGAIITAYEKFIFLKLANIIRIVLNPLVMVLLLSIGYKAITMVVVITLFNILTLCANALFCFYKIKIKVRFGRFNWSFLKEISVYSLWVFLDAIVSRFYSSVGQFVLGIYRGTSAVAIYALSIQLKSLFTSFSTALNSVLLPKLTLLVSQNKDDRVFSDLFIRISRLQYFVMSYILIGFIIFGKEFIVLWGGNDYVQTYYVALIILIPFSFDLISNVGITILQAKNKLKYRSLPMVIGSILGFVLSFPVTKYFGLYGCVIVISVSILLTNVIVSNIIFYKIANINVIQYWKDIIKCIWLPIGMILVSFYFKKSLIIDSWQSLILYILIFSLIYIPLNYVFCMNKLEKEFVYINMLKCFRLKKLNW